MHARQRLDVDLDDLDQGQQVGKFGFQLDDVVEGQREAGSLERSAALDDSRCRRHGLENFQHHRMARQQFEHVAEQEGFVNIDEAAMAAQRCLDAEFAEGVGDDRSGGLHAVGYLGEVAAAATEEQFVGVQPLLAVEDGLSSEKKLVGGCVAHENSLER